jgi:hypothetical protein
VHTPTIAAAFDLDPLSAAQEIYALDRETMPGCNKSEWIARTPDN